MTAAPVFRRSDWRDCPENPVIGFFRMPRAGFAIGDPQILTPGQFDGLWHAFYHGFYEDFTPFYHHLSSPDGVRWTLERKWPWRVGPSALFHEGGDWIVYTTVVAAREEFEACGATNFIAWRKSPDLEHWSDPVPVLYPEQDWEREHDEKPYLAVQARNPHMVRLAPGRFRLYYSAGTVMLPLCNYEEPKYVSFADAPTPFGPFVKHGSPILSPDPRIPHRNYGAGAIKVFGADDGYTALYNSIYLDGAGRPHSAINQLFSEDGIVWRESPENPVLPPTEGFKSQFVYQLDLVRFGGELRLYYNGRDGWDGATESIGFSSAYDVPGIRKLWDLE